MTHALFRTAHQPRGARGRRLAAGIVAAMAIAAPAASILANSTGVGLAGRSGYNLEVSAVSSPRGVCFAARECI